MLKTVDMDQGLKILDSHNSFIVHHSFAGRALSVHILNRSQREIFRASRQEVESVTLPC
jgi:hypothetical protein